MHTQTFKQSTIQSAFKNIRLIFYNSEIIFQKIRALSKPRHISIPSIPLDLTDEINAICVTTSHHSHKVKS